MFGRIKTLAAALIFFAALVTGCGERIDLIGKPAPEFKLKLVMNNEAAGPEIDSKKLSGKPYILYYFASW